MASSRREFLGRGLAAMGTLAMGRSAHGRSPARVKPRPIIDCTDLYHPAQDPGDNFDIVAAYALPEVDLRAVVLDVTERYRNDFARDPGVIPLTQLNMVFDRNVPCGVTPFAAMASAYDRMLDAPGFQQTGVELLLDTLRISAEPVDILSFGSARAVAVAYNREPDLMLERVRLVHLCAGTSEPGFMEWNVDLDRCAFIRVLRSRLPVAIYPCATKEGPFAYGPHNCFYLLENLGFIRDMAPRLRQYLIYAFTSSTRPDFLRFLDEETPEEVLREVCARRHNVWETCVWAQVADRRIARRADGTHRLMPASEVTARDTVLPNELRPCKVRVDHNAVMAWEPTDDPTRFFMYDRGNPHENERALREALPELYLSFRP